MTDYNAADNSAKSYALAIETMRQQRCKHDWEPTKKAGPFEFFKCRSCRLAVKRTTTWAGSMDEVCDDV